MTYIDDFPTKVKSVYFIIADELTTISIMMQKQATKQNNKKKRNEMIRNVQQGM